MGLAPTIAAACRPPADVVGAAQAQSTGGRDDEPVVEGDAASFTCPRTERGRRQVRGEGDTPERSAATKPGCSLITSVGAGGGTVCLSATAT